MTTKLYNELDINSNNIINANLVHSSSIGVGILSPSGTVHILGTGATANDFIVENTTSGTSARARVRVVGDGGYGHFEFRSASSTNLPGVLQIAADTNIVINPGNGAAALAVFAADSLTINKPTIVTGGTLQLFNSGATGYLTNQVNALLYFSQTGGAYPFDSNGNLILQPRTNTGNAKDIVFATGDTTPVTRMVINSSGNVGIGTTSPTALMHLAASTTSRSSLRIHSGTAPTTPNAGDIWNDGTDFNLYGGGLKLHSGVIKPASDSTTALQLANAAGTSVLTVDTTNKCIAIGATSAAGYALRVAGGYVEVQNTTLSVTGTYGYVAFGDGGRQFRIDSSTESYFDVTGSGGGVLRFRLSNSSTTVAYWATSGLRFWINAAIGQNAVPTAAADLAASTTAAASLRIRSGTAPTTPNAGDIWNDGTDFNLYGGGLKLHSGVIKPASDSTTALQLANAAGTAVLTVDTTNGRVGIGTTSPEGVLHLHKSGADWVNLKIERSAANLAAAVNFLAQSAASGTPDWFVGKDHRDTSDADFRIWRYTGSHQTADFTIDETGNVGIGTTSPDNILTISKNQNGDTWASLYNTDAGINARVGFRVGNGANGSFVVGGTGYTGLASWQDALIINADTGLSGGIKIRAGSGGVQITGNTSNPESNDLYVNTAGNVGIGTTSPGAKLEVSSSGAADGIIINNTATDGDPYLSFALSGTKKFTMGVDDGDEDKFKIGTTAIGTGTALTINSSGQIGIGTTAPANPFEVHLASVMRLKVDTNGDTVVGRYLFPSLHNTYDIGLSGLQWKNIFLVNAPVVSSDARIKENIQESDLGLNFINKLIPRKYDKIKTGSQSDSDTKNQYGLIAQELEEVLIELGVEFGGLVYSEDVDRYSIRYTELISPIIKSIQELDQKYDNIIKTLINKVDELTSRLNNLEGDF